MCAGDEGQGSAGVRAPTDYVCGHVNAIYLEELTCLHVRDYDAHQRADGNGCAPFQHVNAYVYASKCMLR